MEGNILLYFWQMSCYSEAATKSARCFSWGGNMKKMKNILLQPAKSNRPLLKKEEEEEKKSLLFKCVSCHLCLTSPFSFLAPLTGEKPFSCPHCNRAFADRSNLRAHLQTHSDVKKYQCKNCSKTFSRMSLLHKHEESGCCVAH